MKVARCAAADKLLHLAWAVHAFPPADMVAMINENIGEGLRVFIGVAEILAAIGWN